MPKKRAKPKRKPRKAVKPRPKPRRKASFFRKRPAKPKPRPHAKPSDYMPKVEAIISEIRELKIQGAKDLAVAGIRCMRIAAEGNRATRTEDFVEDMRKVGELVSSARPTEPALRNSVAALLAKLDKYELRRIDNIRKYAQATCDRMVRDMESMLVKIAGIGAGMISEGDTILTHCHSSHVVAILKEAKAQKKNFRVIVTETEPMRQGLKTAKELLEAMIPTAYCVDSAIGYLMKKVDKVLVGCDAILADGSVVNKIGTLPVAIVAQKFSVPFFVAGESIKFDRQTMEGAPEPIEQRSAYEIAGAAELRGAEVINPAFDTVPADLVTALITELGVMKPELLRHELGF